MRRTDTLIQADRRVQLCLQSRMIDDVVMRQRLLNHHQIELIQLLQPVCIGQRVGGIRVRHQLDARKLLPHLPDHVHVPTRLDLHLDALVSVREFLFNLLQQLRDGVLHTDGHAARNLPPRAASDVLPQRHTRLPRFQIPHCGFQSAASHLVSADMVRQRRHVFGAGQFPPYYARNDVVLQ